MQFYNFFREKKDTGAKQVKGRSLLQIVARGRAHFLRWSIQEQIIFAQRLAMLLKSGMPILQALDMLRKQAATKSVARIVERLCAEVASGQDLSISMGACGKVFGEFAVNIVRVGELSGTLHENLQYLAAELKKRQALQRKVRGALLYPAIVGLATAVISVMLTVFVFPKVTPIFKSLNFDLPWMTRVLIVVSSVLTHQWWLVLLVLFVLVAVCVVLLRIPRVKLMYHRHVLTVPAIGPLLQSYYLANITRTFGLLLKSEVPIVRAIKITADVTTNTAYKQVLRTLQTTITDGKNIANQLGADAKLFPPIMSQMIGVGESSGNLSQSLFFLADMYEAEVDDKSKNLSIILEPLLLIVMGLLVGFIAISIITPIYQVTQHLQTK